MRLLFTSLGSPGHMFPLLPLAVAARNAGHQVTFATAHDYLASARNAGLDAVAVGPTIAEVFAAELAKYPPGQRLIPAADQPAVIGRLFGREMPSRFVAELPAVFAEYRPDLVVYETGNPGGGLAAWQAGIPAAAHSFGRFSPGGTGDRIRATVREYAAELGNDDVSMLYLGNPHIDICPTSAQARELVNAGNRVPLRPVGWNDPGELPAGVTDRDRPLVYLTLGTAMGNVPMLRAAIDGLSTLDVDVLVATGPTVDPAALGEVGSNVRLESWVPQAALLAHVDLVVHHGGSGTTLGAFGAGLPQLLLPQGADQFSNADMVLELGVGQRLSPEELTVDAVREHARTLLTDDAVAAATKTLADEVAAMPAPADVAAHLPALSEVDAG